MQNESLLLFRVVFTGLFLVTLFAGGYMFMNFERLFGPDKEVPSENGSSRSLNMVQVFSIWAHFALLTGALALFLH